MGRTSAQVVPLSHTLDRGTVGQQRKTTSGKPGGSLKTLAARVLQLDGLGTRSSISPVPSGVPPSHSLGSGTVGQAECEVPDWNAEDWLAFFDERAAIGEHDAGLQWADAEGRAYECCIIEWLIQHPPPPTAPARCGHCGAILGEYDSVPFLTDGGHVWLHDACHAPWLAARRTEAAISREIFQI